MGFWSGLTGHQPGAFKGFSMKDIFDKDMWERRERLNQGRRFEETGVPETTNWYRGRGRPEMMGPRVGAAGVSSGAQPRMGVGRDRPFPITPRQQPAQDQTFPYVPTPRARAENLLTPSWAGSAASADRDVGMGANRFLQLGDPRNIRSGPDLPPASQADRTTTIKKFADPNKSDEETTVIKDRIQGGPAYNRPPPNWMMRTGVMGEGYFGGRIPSLRPASPASEDDIREMLRVLEGMEARRGY